MARRSKFPSPEKLAKLAKVAQHVPTQGIPKPFHPNRVKFFGHYKIQAMPQSPNPFVQPRRAPVPHESIEQQQVIYWKKLHEREWPELGLLYAIPNGHGVHIKIRMTMLAEGILTGIPDLCLPVPKGNFHALYIEMKHGSNKTTPEQVRIATLLQHQGNGYAVCYSHKEAEEVLAAYLEKGMVIHPMPDTPKKRK